MVGKLKDDYEFGIKPDWRYYSMGKVFTILRRHSYKWLQEYSAYTVKSSLQPIETYWPPGMGLLDVEVATSAGIPATVGL